MGIENTPPILTPPLFRYAITLFYPHLTARRSPQKAYKI